MSQSPIVFKKSWGTIAEVRFDRGSIDEGFDIVHFLHSRKSLSEVAFDRVQTRVVDLTKSEDLLLADMNNTTRYEIKRAGEKDNLNFEHFLDPSEEEIEKFLDGYASFAKSKGLSAISKAVYLAYSRHGALSLTKVFNAEKKGLAAHSYFKAEDRVRLLHSFTWSHPDSDRNFLSRANRWHHWNDFLWFKSQEIKEYDFGGIYIGSEDQHKLNINKFKEGFGGLIEEGFNRSVPFTWKGRAYLFLRKFL